MKYVIGIDFGTLSCRAVLVTESGELVRSAQKEYVHGVIEAPDGKVLQEPQDYLDSLAYTVRQVAAGYETQIVSLGIDFTACTVLPVDSDLRPLEKARLWKSHSAQPQADRIQALCNRLGVDLRSVGGTVSPQFMLPKLLDLKEQQPKIYEKTAHFLEAADWLVWLLTGNHVRSACMAGFKGLWDGQWPSTLLTALDLDEKMLQGRVLPTGSFAGSLNDYGVRLLGLRADTAVAVACIDAHAALPAAGICQDGQMMLSLGTSGCQVVLSRTGPHVPGIFGRVKDGLLPGYYAYECGQPCLGDMFGWFMENCVPYSYYEAAQGDMFGYMETLAAQVKENPVWAIDWWNGSRTPYSNSRLTGCLFGLTLGTRPEHIYRALLEAAAFGTRQILQLLESRGVRIQKVYAGGGIAKKNPLFMQMLADVLGREITVTENEPAAAMGTAMLAAWAGGIYETPEQAITAMAKAPGRVYYPAPDVNYEAAYARYVQTADTLSEK